MNDEVDSKHESFAAFYSETSQSTDNKDTSTLLPLLLESVNSPSVVRHCMGIIKTLVANLNPGQSTIITGDQQCMLLENRFNGCTPTNMRIVYG